MVKVNESKQESFVHGGGLHSSLESDGSFVVLERSAAEEPSGHFVPHMASMSVNSPPPVPPHGVMAPSMTPYESQNSGYSSADLSPEEIQRKLHQVLQENSELKETLHQNNLAMKQQFNTLVMWQQEVFKVHQTHKEKFAETKDLIIKLRAENTELKKILDEYKNDNSSAPSAAEMELKLENAELKRKVSDLEHKLAAPTPRHTAVAGPSKKEQELSAVLERVNQQLETAERARRQLSLDVERLTAQRTRLERDLASVKQELEEQRQKTQTHVIEKEQLEKEMTRLLEQHKQEIEEYVLIENEQQSLGGSGVQHLTTELAEQRALVKTLKKQLNEERQKVPTSNPSAENGQALPRGYGEKLEQCANCLNRENERFSSLDSWLQEANNSISHWKGKQGADPQTVAVLHKEMEELRSLLAKEQAHSQERKKDLEEAQNKFRELYAAYTELQTKYKKYQDEDKQNSHYQATQTRGFTEKIDSLTAQMMGKDEVLANKNKEIKQLQEKLKKLELENEEISILKAQVEVYQSDFNAERDARQNLAGEKERLAEDLRHLQRRNQQLLDELETYQRNQFQQIQLQASAPVMQSGWNTIAAPTRTQTNRERISHSPSPGRQPSPPKQQETPFEIVKQEESPMRVFDEEVPPPKRYTCPVCNVSFNQLNHLEYHVETCIE